MYEPGDSAAARLSRQQMNVITQLFRVMPSMRHIEEVFQWLAYAIAQQFDVQLIQFWASAMSRTGQRSMQLRTMVHQDPSLPEQVVVNDQTMQLAQRVVSEQRSIQPQPIVNIFAQYQTLVLRRHGLNYCAGNFLNANVLLPPRNTTSSQEMVPTLFAMTVLLFLRQSPHIDLVPTVGNILEQAVSLGGSRGLLLPATNAPPSFAALTPPPLTPQAPPQNASPPLTELIPRRKQDANLLLTSNPFASAAVISDKQARRLHTAIDGRTTIAGLCNTTGMSLKDVYSALQTLLTQDRIEMYDPSGQLIDPSHFLNGH